MLGGAFRGRAEAQQRGFDRTEFCIFSFLDSSVFCPSCFYCCATTMGNPIGGAPGVWIVTLLLRASQFLREQRETLVVWFVSGGRWSPSGLPSVIWSDRQNFSVQPWDRGGPIWWYQNLNCGLCGRCGSVHSRVRSCKELPFKGPIKFCESERASSGVGFKYRRVLFMGEGRKDQEILYQSVLYFYSHCSDSTSS